MLRTHLVADPLVPVSVRYSKHFLNLLFRNRYRKVPNNAMGEYLSSVYFWNQFKI